MVNRQDSLAAADELHNVASAGEQFQALMSRVWLDNAMIAGSQELNLVLHQIIESAANSQELFTSLGKYPEQRKALQREWEVKEQGLQKLVDALLKVQAQIRRERQILWCKE